jgi:hypothetical protein
LQKTFENACAVCTQERYSRRLVEGAGDAPQQHPLPGVGKGDIFEARNACRHLGDTVEPAGIGEGNNYRYSQGKL